MQTLPHLSMHNTKPETQEEGACTKQEGVCQIK